MQFGSDSLDRNIHMSILQEVIMLGSCSPPPDPLHTKKQILVLLPMPFYSLVQLSLCSGPSPDNTSTLLRLCWGREQIFMWWQVWRSWTMCPTWMCCRYCLSSEKNTSYRKVIQVGYRESRAGLWKLFLFGSCLVVDFPVYLLSPS